jgi:hypothetical protein
VRSSLLHLPPPKTKKEAPAYLPIQGHSRSGCPSHEMPQSWCPPNPSSRAEESSSFTDYP